MKNTNSSRIAMNLLRAFIFPTLAAFSVFATAAAQVYTPGAGRVPPRPTGVISGFVVDENAAPVAGVIVQAQAEIPGPNGTTIPVGRTSPRTDQGGRFVIDGLPAQSFLVAAMPPPRRAAPFPGVASTSNDDPVYALTYYPGVISRAQAVPVVVTENGDQSILIELRRVQPLHVRGTVASNSGRSPGGLQLVLAQSLGGSGVSRPAGFVQDDGSFDVGGIAPGSYTLLVRVSMEPGAEFAARDITLADRDLDGVALTLGSGGTVNGRIVFEGAAPGPAPLGANITVGSFPGMMPLGRPLGPAAISEDWTFRVQGLYGTYRPSTPAVLIGRYQQVRVELDGRNIGTVNSSFDIREGEHQLILHFAPLDRR